MRRHDGRAEDLPSKCLSHLGEGDTVEIYTTGGGGYGDPIDREPARVLEDLLDGRVSAEAARRDYGVVFDAAGRSVDGAATASLRARLRGAPTSGAGRA